MSRHPWPTDTGLIPPVKTMQPPVCQSQQGKGLPKPGYPSMKLMPPFAPHYTDAPSIPCTAVMFPIQSLVPPTPPTLVPPTFPYPQPFTFPYVHLPASSSPVPSTFSPPLPPFPTPQPSTSPYLQPPTLSSPLPTTFSSPPPPRFAYPLNSYILFSATSPILLPTTSTTWHQRHTSAIFPGIIPSSPLSNTIKSSTLPTVSNTSTLPSTTYSTSPKSNPPPLSPTLSNPPLSPTLSSPPLSATPFRSLSPALAPFPPSPTLPPPPLSPTLLSPLSPTLVPPPHSPTHLPSPLTPTRTSHVEDHFLIPVDDEKSTVSSSNEEGSDHISYDHMITKAKKAKLDVECISVHSVSSIESNRSSDASEMEYDQMLL